jgi:hypothetical protein
LLGWLRDTYRALFVLVYRFALPREGDAIGAGGVATATVTCIKFVFFLSMMSCLDIYRGHYTDISNRLAIAVGAGLYILDFLYFFRKGETFDRWFDALPERRRTRLWWVAVSIFWGTPILFFVTLIIAQQLGVNPGNFFG